MGNLLLKVKGLLTKIALGKVWNFKLNVVEAKAVLDTIDRNNDDNITLYELVTALVSYVGKKKQ